MNHDYERAVRAPCLAGLLFLLLAAAAIAVEEEDPTGWAGQINLSAVVTSGNAEAETFGLRAKFSRAWALAALEIEGAGLRAETTTTESFGIGTPDDFRRIEESTSELIAENYLLRGRFDRSISERVFWFLGAEWDRNTFAGIDSRYIGSVGAGHHWTANDDGHFSTTYGVSYSREEFVVGVPESFGGVRLGVDYLTALTATTEFGSVLFVDANLEQRSDYRLDFTNWVDVTMTDRLALRLSLQALYNNDPALEELPLFDENGQPTGEVGLAPVDELDLLLNIALVVDF